MQIKLKNNLGYVKIFNINISIMLKWKKEKEIKKIFERCIKNTQVEKR